MSRKSNVRFIKPRLEHLEDRIQPTVLIGSQVVPTMVNQLNTVLKDMQGAQTKLATDYNQAVTDITINPNGDNVRQFTHSFGKAVADYQQILSDQASIHSMVSTDNTVLQQTALAELIAGVPFDFIV